MKVLQVNKFYHPTVGGVEHVVRQLATGLSERHYEARVLAATQRGSGGLDRVDGLPVHRVSSLGVALSTPVAPTYPRALRKLTPDTDVVHYHLPNPLAAVSHLLVRPAKPTVITYHSDIVRQARALRVYRPLLEWFLDDVDRIVTTSPRLRNNSELLADRREKIDVVPLGVDLDDIDAGRTGVSQPVPNEGPVVLFVGRLNYYKGIPVLLRAIQEVKGATLLVVGTGKRRERLETMANELGIADRVHFLGFVGDDRLDACYRAADVFVLPSVEPSEAFGIVQLEAMARGLPVINTDLPSGVPWVSRDGETGVTVPPDDPGALAKAINDLLGNPDRREAFGRRARERIEKEFTLEQMMSRYIDLYRDVCNRLN